MLRILNILSDVSEAIGLTRFYYGHIEELIKLINVEGKQNIAHLPALFLLMDLRYTHQKPHLFGIRLDILIAVQSDNSSLPEERFASTMIKLDEYRAAFEKEIAKKVVSISNIGGILRPKVADVWNSNTKGKAIFNEAIDGIEIVCDLTYDDRVPCKPLELRGVYTGEFAPQFL